MLIPLVVNGVTFKQWKIGSSSPKVYRVVSFALNPAATTIRSRNGLELVTVGRCLVASMPFLVGTPAGWVPPPPTPLSTQLYIDASPAVLSLPALGPHIYDADWTTNDTGAEPNGLLSGVYGAVGLGVTR